MKEQLIQMLIEHLGEVLTALSTALIGAILRYIEKKGLGQKHKKEVEQLKAELTKRNENA